MAVETAVLQTIEEGYAKGYWQKMKRLILISLVAMTSVSLLYGADNEIFIDQSGATSNLDIEQVGGSGNIIGGATAAAGSMTALDIDGATMTLDILQKGSTNKFLGDIWADTYTGYFSFIGDTNTFNMSTDETNATGADGSNVNVQVTGNTNTMTLNHAMTALAANLDLDWTIQGGQETQ